MSSVQTGLDNLINSADMQKKITGNIGYLCHSASVDKDLNHGLIQIKNIFKDRLKKVFAPQHGFVSDVQDNMIESDHYVHPYFDLKIYSLYSETRIPTDEMLEGLDAILVDLQDVGTRIYTYIYTMTLLMQACTKKDIKVYVLDRPNPIGGEKIEGNVLNLEYKSFVGLHELPVRHALTIGEVAKMANKYFQDECDLEVIPMIGWQRSMFFENTGLPWVLPSPNLPTVDGCFTFVGTVLFEGTNISEGRGTTRALEIVGHPKIEPFSFYDQFMKTIEPFNLEGFKLRPLGFQPTFQKHAGVPCGGFQIHVTDRSKFDSFKLSQLLCYEFYHQLGSNFKWKEPPYEYEYHKNPIDLINGGPELREWIEKKQPLELLDSIDQKGRENYLSKRSSSLLY